MRSVGIRFKKAGKVYYFDPDGLKIEEGQFAIVETARGVEFGSVVKGNTLVEEEEVFQPLKKVMRVATEEDKKQEEEDKKKEQEAFEICEEKISKHNLVMKLVDVGNYI